MQDSDYTAPQSPPAASGQSTSPAPRRNWRDSRDQANTLWLTLDCEDSSTNTLSTTVLEEFSAILEEIESHPPSAVVIRSAKTAGFCAGADISEFRGISEPEAVSAVLEQGHVALDRFEQLGVPTIAVIHGHCLGGGLELALACDIRIGIEGLQAGFPEIMLGLHPGLGGTFRLTELINPTAAMRMMLTGKPARDSQALKLGLVDTIVRERHADAAVRAALAGGLDGKDGKDGSGAKAKAGKIRAHKQGFTDRMLNTRLAREFIHGRMREMSEKQAPSRHYPAPFALITLWQRHGGDRARLQKAEIRSFARLLATETAQNLIRVFFLRQALKDRADNDPSAASRKLDDKARQTQHIHVIGAGAMGADIAAVCALQGHRVTLADQATEPLGRAVKRATRLCRRKHRNKRQTREILDRLVPDLHGAGISQADLVIEAVPEDADLKRRVYETAEANMKPGAILASNTSSIPLEELAKGLRRPEAFLGLHFFNPVASMMVVEVVRQQHTRADMIQTASRFVAGIGKLPVTVSSYPGFLVNRALTPYMLEAILLFTEGNDIETIDRCARDFGMPVGPVELADMVGLDVCLSVADVLKASLEKPLADIPDWLRSKVEKGELGKKTGKGFYVWKDGKAKKHQNSSPLPRKAQQEMEDRLILPMLNACVECHRLKVIDSLDEIDGALILGTGFAPFTGGPMHYARKRGISDVVESLQALTEQHGERFSPDPGWQQLSR